MNKNLLLVALCIFVFGYQLQAQQTSEKGYGIVNLERHQFTFGTGFRYEIGLFRNVSASTSLAPALAMYGEGYTFGLAWNIRMRYYHNFQERLDINKNIVGNSANYIGPARSAFFGALQLANNFDTPNGFDLEFFGGVYGIQRTYRSGFNFNAELGFGYYRSEFIASGYGGLFSFMVGWVPPKRKAKKAAIQWQN
jgi:hypothetical protein